MSERSVCLWGTQPLNGGGTRDSAVGSALSSDQLLLGLPWKSHMCVLGGGLSLPESRAPGKPWYRNSLGQHFGELIRGSGSKAG